ncbi:MAG: aliphatic sulfonate ABC transporter substrate-binding protein [Liquorilactobacillus ghanensis]|uniref:aliphatic sulfonate ABC transporter substrate-binding protein n=1 Tax=Liquorilactobacillus ghanensis TaxID=399370 RepID=UPI0039E80F02
MFKNKTIKCFFKIILAIFPFVLSIFISTNGQASKTKTISIGYQSGMPVLTIAKEKGDLAKTLEKKGYKITWHYFNSTSDMIDATGNASGIDFGGGGATASIFAQASNKDIVNVAAQTGAHHGSAIITRKNSGIKSIKELKGKKVALTKGTAQQYLLVEALKKAGLHYSDIKPVYMTPSDALAAYKKGGQFAAWAIWDPLTAQAQKSAGTKVLADNESVFGKSTDRQFAAYFFTSATFLKNNRSAVKVIISELKKSATWYRKNPKAAAKLLSKAYNTDFASLYVAAKRSGSRKIIPVNKQLLTSYKSQADVFYDLNLISRKINVYDQKYYWDYEK